MIETPYQTHAFNDSTQHIRQKISVGKHMHRILSCTNKTNKIKKKLSKTILQN